MKSNHPAIVLILVLVLVLPVLVQGVLIVQLRMTVTMIKVNERNCFRVHKKNKLQVTWC